MSGLWPVTGKEKVYSASCLTMQLTMECFTTPRDPLTLSAIWNVRYGKGKSDFSLWLKKSGLTKLSLTKFDSDDIMEYII